MYSISHGVARCIQSRALYQRCTWQYFSEDESSIRCSGRVHPMSDISHNTRLNRYYFRSERSKNGHGNFLRSPESFQHGDRNEENVMSDLIPHLLPQKKLKMHFLVSSTLCLKKVPTFKLSVTLSNLNRFSKFLHCTKAYEICYKTLPTSA